MVFEAQSRLHRGEFDDFDWSLFAYDLPHPEEDPSDEQQELDPSYDDYDPYDDDEHPDDDELFSSLDEALDEIEAESRAQAILAISHPEFDQAEPIPGPTATYRAHVVRFLGREAPRRAPPLRPVVPPRRHENEVLSSILRRGLHRARRSFDERKAVGRITNPKLRAQLRY